MQGQLACFYAINGLTGRVLACRQENYAMGSTATESCGEMAELGWVIAMDENDVQGSSVTYI